MKTPFLQTTIRELIETEPSTNIPALIVAIIISAGIYFLVIRRIVKEVKKRKKNKKNNDVSNNRVVSRHSTFTHVNGLPVAENMPCEIFSLPEKYEINAGGMVFNLEKQKVTDVCIKKDTEIQQQYVSSAGGAVGGALLFGPLGAIIGGRTKNKKTTNYSEYLIITYMSENEVKYIGFDVTNKYLQATKFVSDFKNNNDGNTKNIEL